MTVGNGVGKSRQFMRPHLCGRFEARSELDQRWLAKGRAKEAHAKRRTKYDTGRHLPNGIARSGGEARRSKDEFIAVEQVGRPGRVIGRRDDCIELELTQGRIDPIDSCVMIYLERLV